MPKPPAKPEPPQGFYGYHPMGGKGTLYKGMYVPEPFSEPSKEIPARFKGKQLFAGNKAYLSRHTTDKEKLKHLDKLMNCFDPVSYVPAPYVGGVTSYRDSEMATKYKYDKPVFNSRDFTKRDEFSNDIRTKQWRILLEKELAVTSKALESTMAKAGLSIASPQKGMGDSSSMPEFSPMRTGGAGSSDDGGSPGGMTALQASLFGSRNFTKPTQFDRLRDERASKDLYNTRRFYKADHEIAPGEMLSASRAIGEDIEKVPLGPPEFKRVAVTHEFFRASAGFIPGPYQGSAAAVAK